MDDKKALELAATGMGIIHLGTPEIAKLLLFMREFIQISSQYAPRLFLAGDREGALTFARLAIAGEALPGCHGLANEARSICKQLGVPTPTLESLRKTNTGAPLEKLAPASLASAATQTALESPAANYPAAPDPA